MSYQYERYDDGIRLTNYIGHDQKLEIPETIDSYPVRALGENLFFEHGEDLLSITIPDSVFMIEKDAFKGCFQLESLQLGNHVEVLEEGFLGSCVLENLTIPSSVLKIGGIEKLDVQLQIDQNNPVYQTDGFGIYAKNQDEQLELCAIQPNQSVASYNVQEGTTTILENAFFHQEPTLKEVGLPNSLIHIEEGALQATAYTFQRYCDLKAYHVSNTNFEIKDGCLIEVNDSKKTILTYFKHEKRLEMNDQIDRIGKDAFLHSPIKELVFTYTPKSIAMDAFYGSHLEKMVFKDQNLVFLFPKIHEVLRDDLLEGFGRNGKIYEYSYFERYLKHTYLSNERIRLIVNRLHYPLELNDEDQTYYEDLLTSKYQEVIELLVKNHDYETLDAYLNLGFLDDEMLQWSIGYCSNNQAHQETTLLVAYQMKYSNHDFDFSL